MTINVLYILLVTMWLSLHFIGLKLLLACTQYILQLKNLSAGNMNEKTWDDMERWNGRHEKIDGIVHGRMDDIIV